MDKKICTDCSEEKLLSDFNKNRAKPDGLQSKCRPCMQAYRRDHYQRTKPKYLADMMARRAIRKERVVKELYKYLSEHPCVDCQIQDPRVLEFDHQDPRLKEYTIARMLGGDYSWDAVVKEIEKCDVRCANCHRIRTMFQFDTYRSYWNE